MHSQKRVLKCLGQKKLALNFKISAEQVLPPTSVQPN